MTVERFFKLTHDERQQVKDMFPNRPQTLGSQPSGVVKKAAVPREGNSNITKTKELLAAAQATLTAALSETQAARENDSTNGTGSGVRDPSSASSAPLIKQNGICLSNNLAVIPQNVRAGRIGKNFPFTKYLEPAGLPNRTGVRCYRSSILQCLFHTPEFYHLLGNMHKACAKNGNECVTCALQRITQGYWNGDRKSTSLDDDFYILDKALKKVINWDSAIQNDREQGDPYDMLLHFVRYLQWDHTGIDPHTLDAKKNVRVPQLLDLNDPTSFTIPSVFEIKYNNYWTCSACNDAKPTWQDTEFGMDLRLLNQRPSGDSLESYLEDSRMWVFRITAPKICTSDICRMKQQVEGYVVPMQTMVRRIANAPQILIIRQLRIFAEWIPERRSSSGRLWQKASRVTRRLTQKINYGTTLNLTEHVDHPLETPLRLRELKYRLRGVVVHHGRGIEGGHYTVAVERRDPKGTYSTINDKLVGTPKTDPRDLLDPKFGAIPYVLVYSKM